MGGPDCIDLPRARGKRRGAPRPQRGKGGGTRDREIRPPVRTPRPQRRNHPHHSPAPAERRR